MATLLLPDASTEMVKAREDGMLRHRETARGGNILNSWVSPFGKLEGIRFFLSQNLPVSLLVRLQLAPWNV